jgi:hypothetical protein
MSATRCPECYHDGTVCPPGCVNDLDGHHEDNCPCMAAEERYWARHFGQDYGTQDERRARLKAMRPGGPTDEEIQDMRDAGRII